MKRFGQWAMIFVGGLIVGWVLLRVGLGIYLRSSSGREAVAGQLQDIIGMPVEVSELDLGSNSSSISFRVLEPASSANSRSEVLSVQTASADVSFADVLTRRVEPKHLTFSGVNLTLRVGSDGQLLTTFPNQGGSGVLPALAIDNARIRVQQEGRPEFTLGGINFKGQIAGEKLEIIGTVDDADWGSWKITGEIDRATRLGWFELNAADVPFNTDRLKTIPFLPSALWDHFQPSGRTSAHLRLTLGAEKRCEYALDIKPADAAITLPDAKATVTHLSGKVSLRDNRLAFTDCRGRFAEGSLIMNGETDLNCNPANTSLRVTAEHLDTRKLPTNWGIPPELTGFLEGSAELRFKITPDGKVDSTGSIGKGKLVKVTYRGQPRQDVPLELVPVVSGLTIRRTVPASK